MKDLTKGDWLSQNLETVEGILVSNHRTGDKTHSTFLEVVRGCRGFIWETKDRDTVEAVEGFHCKKLTISPILFGVPICSKMEFLIGARDPLEIPVWEFVEREVNLGQFLDYGQEVEESEDILKLKEHFSPYWLEGKIFDDFGRLNGKYVFSWEFEYRGYVDAYSKSVLYRVVDMRWGMTGFRAEELARHMGEEVEKVSFHLEELKQAGYLSERPSNRLQGYAYFLTGSSFEIERVVNSKGCIFDPLYLTPRTYVNDQMRLRRLTVQELGRIMGYENVEGCEWREIKERPVLTVWREIYKTFTKIFTKSSQKS